MSEVRVVDPRTGGAKGTKPERFDLIPGEPLAALALHYGIGALKYEDENWKKGYDWKHSYAALQRHANAWWMGEEWGVEEFQHRETGETIRVTVNHMIAVAWHAFALYYFSLHHRGLSPDRFHRAEIFPDAAYTPVVLGAAAT